MNDKKVNWDQWRGFFAARSDRQLPELEDPQDYSAIPASVARSLAVFQLGESGGGSVVEQAAASRLPAAGREYAEALKLFVREEHRHAEILAICVRNLGGSLQRRNRDARLFQFARRLFGLRTKITVLLAAEVVGLCYYQCLLERLPVSRVRSLLAQIVNDEIAHLNFHCRFLQAEARNPLLRLLFKAAWRSILLAATAVVLVDHRQALRDLELSTAEFLSLCKTQGRLAERRVCRTDPGSLPGNVLASRASSR